MSTIMSVDAYNGVRNVIELAIGRNRNTNTSNLVVPEKNTIQSEHSVVNSVSNSETYRDANRQTPTISQLTAPTLSPVTPNAPIEFDAYTSRAFLVSQTPKALASSFNLVV